MSSSIQIMPCRRSKSAALRCRLGLCRLGLCCLAWLHLCGGRVSAQTDAPPTKAEPSKVQPTSDLQSEVLIRELGSPSYEGREKASEALLRLGIAARPDLELALNSNDAEVRYRARKILTKVLADDLAKRIEAFIRDVDGKQKLTLPGWESFSKQFGTDNPARELFVEMIRDEGPLVEAIQTNDAKVINEKLRGSIGKLTQRMQAGAFQKTPPAGQAAAQLLAASHPDVSLDDRQFVRLTQFAYQSVFFQKAVRSTQGPSRKLLQQWLAKDSGAMGDNNKLMMAVNFTLPETLDIGRRCLKPDRPGRYRLSGILAVAALGKADDIALLEPLLNDETVGMTQQINKKKIEIQIRDVALAGVVKLSGQDLKKYGFSAAAVIGPQIIKKPDLDIAQAFAIDAPKRDAGIKQWREWRAAQPAKPNQ
jgi:hypothetical protein